MARRSIEQADVSAACNELMKADETPSTLAVYKKLGRGSYTTIQKFMAVWQNSDDGLSAKADQLPVVIELPESFQSEATRFLKQIFNLAEQEHSIALERNNQEKEQAIAAGLAEAEAAIEIAEAANARLESECDKHKVEKERFESKITGLEQKIGVSKAEFEALNQKNLSLKEELQKQIDLLKEASTKTNNLTQEVALLKKEVDIVNKQLTNSNTTHAETIKTLKAEHTELIKTTKIEHAETIKALKASHAEANKTLKASHTEATKDLKASHAEAIKTLKASHTEAIKAFTTSTKPKGK